MPLQKAGNGYNFSGRIVEWVSEFEAWYQESVKFRQAHQMSPPKINFTDYMALLTHAYAVRARKKWQNAWFGKGKIEKINALIPDTGQIHVGENVLLALDFLADNLDRSFMTEHKNDVLKYVKEFM